MFGTLRIGSEKNSVEFIEHAQGEAASRLGKYVFSHSACESCRLKKLRCSGQKSGCDRCKNQALKCSYQTAAEANSLRPKSRSRFQANFSSTCGTASTSNTPSPLDNNGVDQEIGGWELTDTDPTGSILTNAQFSRDPNPLNQGEHSNLDDLPQGLSFGGELDYSESEFNDLFNNIADLQPDNIQTNVFMGANRALLDAEAFDSMTETANDMLDDIGDMTKSRRPSEDAQSSFMAFDHAGTSPFSSSRQNSGASGSSDEFNPTSFGRARSRTESSSCQCRRSILRVLAEIESNILSVSPSNMYSVLSYHRRTTAASNSILMSRICNCRIKFFGTLGIIGEKITSLSEAIITAFVCRVKEQDDSVDFDESDSPHKRLLRNGAVRLGEFQVQTVQEFKVVSAAIIKLQLKQSTAFVSRTRELAVSMNHLAQAQSLKKLEGRLKELLNKIQRMASDVELDDCEI